MKEIGWKSFKILGSFIYIEFSLNVKKEICTIAYVVCSGYMQTKAVLALLKSIKGSRSEHKFVFTKRDSQNLLKNCPAVMHISRVVCFTFNLRTLGGKNCIMIKL